MTRLKALPATTCHGACRQNQHRMRCWGKRLRSLKTRATANRGKSPSPKLSKILSRRYKQKLACRSSSCLPVAKIKCKHWTKTPTRPNAFTTNRMQSWPLPTLKCKRERDCLVPKIAGLVPQVLIPAPLFCELVAIWTKGGEWEKLILLTKLKAFTSNYLPWCMPPNQHRMRC